MKPAVVEVTTVVPLAPARAFALFTEALDAWWLRGPRFRPERGASGAMVLEPGPGGRLLERYADGSHVELGRVRAWEPGVRLAFSLRGRDFAPGDSTEVDVRFEGAGEGARVTVRQQGFEALGPPARRGMDEDAFLDTLSVWWADLLSALLRATR